MDDDLTAAEILERAADGFESGRYGWTKGQYVEGNMEAFCSMGALIYEGSGRTIEGMNAFFARGKSVPGVGKAVDALHRHLPDGYDVVPYWNDALIRTKQEVIDMFKNTAKDLRNQS